MSNQNYYSNQQFHRNISSYYPNPNVNPMHASTNPNMNQNWNPNYANPQYPNMANNYPVNYIPKKGPINPNLHNGGAANPNSNMNANLNARREKNNTKNNKRNLPQRNREISRNESDNKVQKKPTKEKNYDQDYGTASAEFTSLVNHENFSLGRSPFYYVENRICTMPVFCKKNIQFRVGLSEENIEKLRSSKATHALHLRLFSVKIHNHQDWKTSNCDVEINKKKVQIKHLKKNLPKGIKKKGHNIIPPLNITDFSKSMMDFSIKSHNEFSGIAVLEITRVFTVDQIKEKIIERSKKVEKKDKKCSICKVTSKLLRCSRCKGVWYCGTKHQARDWPNHQLICIAYDKKPQLKFDKMGDSDDEHDDDNKNNNKSILKDVLCSDVILSLRDPLTIARIVIPCRGSSCDHPQCMDLATYLMYSHKNGNWQCPICAKPLKFDQIAIDHKFFDILKQTDSETDKIILKPNGKFTVYDDTNVEFNNNKKRKISQISTAIPQNSGTSQNTNNDTNRNTTQPGLPTKKQKVNENTGANLNDAIVLD